MQEDLNHDRNAPTDDDRDPSPGPVGIDDENDSRVDRVFLAAEQSSRLPEDEEIETLAQPGRAPLP